MAQEKVYLLDTNVLVHDPQAIFSFENAHIGIPIMVLEELDHFKSENSQRGRNTREIIRFLDLLRERGSLAEGVKLDNGSQLQIIFVPSSMPDHPSLKIEHPDNQILMTALALKEKGFDVKFISKDLNMRVKADVLGIHAFDYLKDTISRNQFYKGWITLEVPAVQLKKDIPPDLFVHAKDYQFSPNEFILVQSQHNPYNFRIFRYIAKDTFKAVEPPPFRWPLQPRNTQQAMALDLLTDPAIQLVILLGPAGTGKTFLALVAALHEVLAREEFAKVLVTRPVIPLGPDIGYLPGDIHAKLHSWMQPIYDNMDLIVHAANAATTSIGVHHEENGEQQHYHKGKHRHRNQHREKLLPALDELIKRGKVSLEAITYMRGRSIPYQYIIIDEVQNLTPHEVKTLISRVGEGSKIILAGDPYQIDSPYLDFSSNGLVVASQRFKGQSLFGTVFLETSERSELSKLAGQLL